MSHFCTVILVPKEEKNIKKYISQTLDQYSEQKEVDPYNIECWCIGNKSKEYAKLKVESEIGSIKENEDFHYEQKLKERIIKKFSEDIYNKIKNKNLSIIEIEMVLSEYEKIQEELSSYWDELIDRRKKLEEKYEKEHYLFNKPDENCCQCGGLGSYETTYNQLAKFDYWIIGGRWSGDLKTYNKNSNGNVSVINENTKKYIGYALVTPDGKWHEKGKVGFWGTASEEKNKDEWELFCKENYNKFENTHLMVLLDCHI